MVLVGRLEVSEGEDVVLIDRPPIPTGADLVQTHMAGSPDYDISVYDLASSTPTTDLLAESGDSTAASTSNVSTEPVVASAVQATTSTYGGIWTQQGRDADGYTVLYRILDSDLSTGWISGHAYLVDLDLTTATYGVIRRSWYVVCR